MPVGRLDAVAVELCIIGATNFESSLNYWIDNQLKNEYFNFFLANLFRWINEKVDVDGDGINCLIDAFRFAATESTEKLHEVKRESMVKIEPLRQKFCNMELKINSGRTPASERQAIEFEIAQVKSKLNEAIDLVTINQEPWMLNPGLGRKIIF